jgi:hypothetical protein
VADCRDVWVLCSARLWLAELWPPAYSRLSLGDGLRVVRRGRVLAEVPSERLAGIEWERGSNLFYGYSFVTVFDAAGDKVIRFSPLRRRPLELALSAAGWVSHSTDSPDRQRWLLNE